MRPATNERGPVPATVALDTTSSPVPPKVRVRSTAPALLIQVAKMFLPSSWVSVVPTTTVSSSPDGSASTPRSSRVLPRYSTQPTAPLTVLSFTTSASAAPPWKLPITGLWPIWVERVEPTTSRFVPSARAWARKSSPLPVMIVFHSMPGAVPMGLLDFHHEPLPAAPACARVAQERANESWWSP